MVVFKMKRGQQQWLGSIFFLLILAALFGYVANVLNFKNEHQWFVSDRQKQLRDLPADFVDILYVGGSKMQVGVSPITVWHESGLAGVNIATNSQPAPITLEVTKKYVELLNPTAVVIDMSGINQDPSPANPFYQTAYTLGLQFLSDLPGRFRVTSRLKKELPGIDLLPYDIQFYRDHVRWKSLQERDFHRISTYDAFTLGTLNPYPITDNSPTLAVRNPVDRYSDTADVDHHSLSYYTELSDYLQMHSVTMITIVPPVIGSREDVARAIKDFSDEHGIILLDYTLDDNFKRMNFANKGDFYDFIHLSITGAVKFSEVLARDLAENIPAKEKSTETINLLEEYYANFEDDFSNRKGAYTTFYDQ